MSKTWTKLVRFEASEDSQIYTGCLGPAHIPVDALPYAGLNATLIEGDPLGEYTMSDKSLTVKRLLCPLDVERIPMVRMIGLNYAKHLLESNKPFPKNPTEFNVAPEAAAGPFDDVRVPVVAQDGHLDYEAELVIIIGKTCRNITKEDAPKYIAGYAVGNDVSSRLWQRENGTQWCFSKGFDTFCPFGPWISSSESINISTQTLSSHVNSESTPRQHSPLTDMIFSPTDIVAFLAQGHTIRAGTVIFSGTPHGIAYAMDPQGWVQNEDTVKVQIEPDLGAIENRYVYEREGPEVMYKPE